MVVKKIKDHRSNEKIKNNSEHEYMLKIKFRRSVSPEYSGRKARENLINVVTDNIAKNFTTRCHLSLKNLVNDNTPCTLTAVHTLNRKVRILTTVIK